MMPVRTLDTMGTLPRTFIDKMPAEQYHVDKSAISQGALQHILVSPAHFAVQWRGPPKTPTQSMQNGTLVHAGLFEPAELARWVVKPDFGDGRTKEAKAAKTDWLLEFGDRPSMTIQESETIRAMIDAIGSTATWQKLTAGMAFEQTVYWQHKQTGIRSRARLDGVSTQRRVIMDLKTTESAQAQNVAKSIENWGYHFQAAHYLEAANQVPCGENLVVGGFEEYVFCFAERTPPHGVKFYPLAFRALTRGQALRDKAYGKLVQCLESTTWPCYEDRVDEPIDLPQWAYGDSGRF